MAIHRDLRADVIARRRAVPVIVEPTPPRRRSPRPAPRQRVVDEIPWAVQTWMGEFGNAVNALRREVLGAPPPPVSPSVEARERLEGEAAIRASAIAGLRGEAAQAAAERLVGAEARESLEARIRALEGVDFRRPAAVAPAPPPVSVVETGTEGTPAPIAGEVLAMTIPLYDDRALPLPANLPPGPTHSITYGYIVPRYPVRWPQGYPDAGERTGFDPLPWVQRFTAAGVVFGRYTPTSHHHERRIMTGTLGTLTTNIGDGALGVTGTRWASVRAEFVDAGGAVVGRLAAPFSTADEFTPGSPGPPRVPDEFFSVNRGTFSYRFAEGPSPYGDGTGTGDRSNANYSLFTTAWEDSGGFVHPGVYFRARFTGVAHIPGQPPLLHYGHAFNLRTLRVFLIPAAAG